MIQITPIIDQLVVDSANTEYPGAVVRVFVRFHGVDSDSGIGAMVHSIFDLSGSQPRSSANFLSFNDLTEEIVLGWIQECSPMQWNAIRLELQSQISLSAAQSPDPLVEVQPPWRQVTSTTDQAYDPEASASVSTDYISTTTSNIIVPGPINEEYIRALVHQVLIEVQQGNQ